MPDDSIDPFFLALIARVGLCADAWSDKELQAVAATGVPPAPTNFALVGLPMGLGVALKATSAGNTHQMTRIPDAKTARALGLYLLMCADAFDGTTYADGCS